MTNYLEITSPFWILTPPVKMVLCQLLQRTNHQKTAWGTEMSSEKEGLQQCEH